jgi:type IV pilus assembly protein PilC
LATFVMPRFVVFFKSLHAKLPLPTRMLLSGSSFFSHWWYVIIGALVALVVGFVAMRARPRARPSWTGSS